MVTRPGVAVAAVRWTVTWSGAIGIPFEAGRTARSEAGGDRVLRAKYLDWCSARIAERFLRLTPEEIYELAQKASSGNAASSRDAASASTGITSADESPVETFRQIVERVTEVLAATMKLPAFNEWSDAYRQQPSRYDDELLGFWKGSGRD
jgi:hypothetical protein